MLMVEMHGENCLRRHGGFSEGGPAGQRVSSGAAATGLEAVVQADYDHAVRYDHADFMDSHSSPSRKKETL